MELKQMSRTTNYNNISYGPAQSFGPCKEIDRTDNPVKTEFSNHPKDVLVG